MFHLLNNPLLASMTFFEHTGKFVKKWIKNASNVFPNGELYPILLFFSKLLIGWHHF